MYEDATSEDTPTASPATLLNEPSPLEVTEADDALAFCVPTS